MLTLEVILPKNFINIINNNCNCLVYVHISVHTYVKDTCNSQPRVLPEIVC